MKFNVHVGLVIAKDGRVTSVIPDNECILDDVCDIEDNRRVVQK